MQHSLQYLLTLRGEDGRPAALLRLRAHGGGYEAEMRALAHLPEDGEIWIFTPKGPVRADGGAGGPVLGAAVAWGGRCLCAGAARGAKIDLPREKLRLRLRLQARPGPEVIGPPAGESGEKSMEGPAGELPPETAHMPEPEPMGESMPEAGKESMEELPGEPMPGPETESAREPAGAPMGEWRAEPIPVMEIIPEENGAFIGMEADNGDADTARGSDVNSMRNRDQPAGTWSGSRNREEEGNAAPEGAGEPSGREPPWPPSTEEERRRSLWVMAESEPKTEYETDAELESEMDAERKGEATEGRSDALREILARAERAFSRDLPPTPAPVLPAASEGVPEPAPDPVQARGGLALPIPNPFPNTFPGAEFRRVHRPQGQGWYLEGEMRRGSEQWLITAMPGEYQPIPPCALQGFHRYIKSRDGGYWLRVQRRG